MSDSSDAEVEQYRQPRIIRDRINFDWHEACFLERFRLSAELVDFLDARLHHALSYGTLRNNCLTVRQQILVCLRFLADNGFYHLTGDAHGVSKSTVHRCIKRVITAINDTLYNELVVWPNEANCREITRQYYEMAGIPSVCACLDGTLINIATPNDNEPQFVDRKGNHSLNVLVITGSNNQFFFCNARWPGSLHDSRVLRNSIAHDVFHNGWRPFPGSVILGDSAYPCNAWLVTPFPNPQTLEQFSFNAAHKITRSSVERTIGILKARFTVLKTPLRTKGPIYSANIVKCCIVLHNLAGNFNLNENFDIEINAEDIVPQQQHDENGGSRQRLFDQYINNR